MSGKGIQHLFQEGLLTRKNVEDARIQAFLRKRFGSEALREANDTPGKASEQYFIERCDCPEA